jgi:hypothetical protein
MIRKTIAVMCISLLPMPALSQGYSRDEGRGSSYDRDSDREDASRDRRYGDRNHRREASDDMPGGAARFDIRVGDARMKVKCDPRETMRVCVDAALTLLDKARSLPQTNASGPSPSGSSKQ